jgi:hypothetical protein
MSLCAWASKGDANREALIRRADALERIGVINGIDQASLAQHRGGRGFRVDGHKVLVAGDVSVSARRQGPPARGAASMQGQWKSRCRLRFGWLVLYDVQQSRPCLSGFNA